MVIDLTYKCSMGCTHCMSNCTSDDIREMSLETLNNVCDFIEKHKIDKINPLILGISGGEIFEHSKITECLDIIFNRFGAKPNIMFMLATNGRVLSETPEYLDYIKSLMGKYGKKKILIQVTDDDRFYPTSLTQKQRYRLEKLGAYIDSVPGNKDDRNKCLYPQGRALKNFNESWWNTKAPKCVNCKLLVYQGVSTVKALVEIMSSRMKNCTPVISPLGEIKLGESALCPPVTTIYDSGAKIISAIRNHRCRACKEAIQIFAQNNKLLSELMYD